MKPSLGILDEARQLVEEAEQKDLLGATGGRATPITKDDVEALYNDAQDLYDGIDEARVKLRRVIVLLNHVRELIA